mmetsp:Transcript_82018/g.144856  ORF Transcript_82018/g.144856 Transcript_82018/m.144856 type:complete len:89 (-) Transcript_82018:586-852(-)
MVEPLQVFRVVRQGDPVTGSVSYYQFLIVVMGLLRDPDLRQKLLAFQAPHCTDFCWVSLGLEKGDLSLLSSSAPQTFSVPCFPLVFLV